MAGRRRAEPLDGDRPAHGAGRDADLGRRGDERALVDGVDLGQVDLIAVAELVRARPAQHRVATAARSSGRAAPTALQVTSPAAAA